MITKSDVRQLQTEKILADTQDLRSEERDRVTAKWDAEWEEKAKVFAYETREILTYNECVALYMKVMTRAEANKKVMDEAKLVYEGAKSGYWSARRLAIGPKATSTIDIMRLSLETIDLDFRHNLLTVGERAKRYQALIKHMKEIAEASREEYFNREELTLED